MSDDAEDTASRGEPLRDPSNGAEPDGPGRDATLGGYLEVHDRPPAFEGIDGHPYTVSIETEKRADLRAPWAAFLVFPRWARTGVGIVGHAETPLLWEGTSRDDVVARAGSIPLLEVKRLLDEAVRRQRDGEPGGGDGSGYRSDP